MHSLIAVAADKTLPLAQNRCVFISKQVETCLIKGTVDIFGSCRRPVVSLLVFQHYAQKLVVKVPRNPGTKHSCRTSCVLSDAFNLRPRLSSRIKFKYFSGKLLLPQRLRYFRGSRFSQCFILSTALHRSLPSKFLC